MKLHKSKANLQEIDIEDWLEGYPEEISFHGITVEGWIARQFQVPSGIIDLLGFGCNSSGNKALVIVEIKNGQITIGALGQACRYAHDIELIKQQIEDNHGPLGAFPVFKVVVGLSIDNQTMFEANALDVIVFEFDINLELEVAGPVDWSESFSNELTEKYKTLASDPQLKSIRNVAERNAKTWSESIEKEQGSND